MPNFSNKLSHLKQAKPLHKLLGWVMVLAVVTLSLTPLPAAPVSMAGGDKLLHLGTYSILSYWFFHIYFKHRWVITIGFVVLGMALEILQSFTPYRFWEWLDMLMNTSGVALAYLVFWITKIRIKWLLAA